MTVGTLCTKSVVSVNRNATAADAAITMRNSHVGTLVVLDPTDPRVPVGIITDRDIFIEVVGQGLAPASVPVESVMSGPVLSRREEDGLLEALTRLAARGVRRAPVIYCNGHIKGLVSVDDFRPLLFRELAKISVLIRREQAGEVRKTEDIFRDEFAT